MIPHSLISIVPYDQSHSHFVYDSFVTAYSKLHDLPTGIPWSGLSALLNDPEWTCVVAVSPDDSDEFMGWMLYRDPNTIAWLYVKPPYRKCGLATTMLASADICKGSIDVAFFSPTAAKLAKTKNYTLRWRPYLSIVAEYNLTLLMMALEILDE